MANSWLGGVGGGGGDLLEDGEGLGEDPIQDCKGLRGKNLLGEGKGPLHDLPGDGKEVRGE